MYMILCIHLAAWHECWNPKVLDDSAFTKLDDSLIPIFRFFLAQVLTVTHFDLQEPSRCELEKTQFFS